MQHNRCDKAYSKVEDIMLQIAIAKSNGSKNTHALELLLDQATEDWIEEVVEDDRSFLINEYSLLLYYATRDEQDRFYRLLHQRGNIITRCFNDSKICLEDEEYQKNRQQIVDLSKRIEERVKENERIEKLERMTKRIVIWILSAIFLIAGLYKLWEYFYNL